MILLRKTTEADKALIMAWRSNTLVYAGFYSQKSPLKWEENKNWWASRNKDWREFIIVLVEGTEMRDVGVVTIGQLDHWSPEIGYFVGEVSLWGKGVGKEAVKLVLGWLKGQGKEYCHTTVLKDNKRSLNLLKRLGFKVLGNAREGEVWLQKKL